MSILGASLARAHAVLADAKGGECVEYRAGTSGTWTDLDGAHRGGQTSEPEYDDQRGAEVRRTACTLYVPEGCAALAESYQVRFGSSDADVWAVRDGPEGSGQSIYQLRRVSVTAATADRGRIR